MVYFSLPLIDGTHFVFSLLKGYMSSLLVSDGGLESLGNLKEAGWLGQACIMNTV